jgi:hypothetical protein
MRTTYLGMKLDCALVTMLAIIGARATIVTQQLSEAPVELVRKTAQNEVAASNSDMKVMFTDRKESPRGSQTKLMVETRQGMAGMTVAFNDKPLTPEQRQAEGARLARLASSQEQLEKKQEREKEDAGRVTRIMKALPDAFVYEPDGTEKGSREVGKAGAELVRLKFHPNPKYSPPSHVEQVLTGMQGYLLIDAGQHRIAKIDGTLIEEVGFGWGVLGHLDQGGHFLVEQGEVIPGAWEITRMSLSFTGRVLLFKSLNIKSDEVFDNFRAAPGNLSFAGGIELLKKQEAQFSDDHQQPGVGKSK